MINTGIEGNGNKIKSKEKAYTFMQRVISMKGAGPKIKNMDRVSIFIKMEIFIEVHSKKIPDTVEV
jgi:hypothetical protein